MVNINRLPDPGQITMLYRRYYAEDYTPDSSISSHWEDFSRRINVSIDRDGNLTSFEGYGFGDLRRAHSLNKVLNYLCNISYLVRLPYGNDIRPLIKKAKEVLKKIDSYLTYDCFRQVCALGIIRNYLEAEEKEALEVLMIGDGYGFLSSLIKGVYPNAKITLIDIGKVLLFQVVNLKRIYPDRTHILMEEFDSGINYDFLYVPSERISKIEKIKYKLIINIASMQEMNYETINNYFRLIRASSRQDNLFYCCNRILKELPGGEIIEFSKYPWDAEDRHLVDEICDFYKYRFSLRFPFFRRFDGPFRHRLTRLKVF